MSFVWVIAASTAGLAYMATWVARHFAPKIGFIDAPDGKKKTHHREMPLLGGVAVFLRSQSVLCFCG